MTAIFISDLHLHASRPAATDCFLRFLATTATTARALYILGDLFEAWIGDDAPGHHDLGVIAGLNRLTATGVSCSFIRGNRDFLISERFAIQSGTSLLPDETVIELHGQRALLMHGDTLCTDDHAYQRYRRLVHFPPSQALYLALPQSLRARIAGFARDRSMTANAIKSESIMDVNRGAVASTMRRHGVSILIHGHTHRPAIHHLDVDGRQAMRIVLGDWYKQGSMLRWLTTGPELQTIAFP